MIQAELKPLTACWMRWVFAERGNQGENRQPQVRPAGPAVHGAPVRATEVSVFWNGSCYLYADTHYVEHEDMTQVLRTWMRQTGHGQSNNVIGNVAPIVLNMAYKDSTTFPDMPFYVGKGAFPEAVIAYRNGILDVTAFLHGSTVLMPHTPKWVSTFCLPYNFNPEAGCPQWLEVPGSGFRR